jgi:hypothetical protein
MNENAKKVAIVVVVILAVLAAIFEGVNTMGGEKEIKKEIGHGTPGHGMKDAENADAKGPAPDASAQQGATDPLAGPSGSGTAPAGGPSGKDR